MSRTELYQKYRPKDFNEVVGQKTAVKSLVSMGRNKNIPHALLFTGPSGCGKTTLVRILRNKMKCSDADFVEMNSANFRGIDTVREIQSRIGLSAVSGKVRIYLIDEVHQQTKQAQEAMLKLLEDMPDHVYFFLATTNPEKLLKAIQTRCNEVKCRNLTIKELQGLITDVCAKEGKKIEESVVKKIADVAGGSARKALVLLDGVLGLSDKKEQLNYLENNDTDKMAFNIVQSLFNPKAGWPTVKKLLAEVEVPTNELEGVRRAVLGYARKTMIGKGNASRAALIMEEFRDNWFDLGPAGLALSCYNVMNVPHDEE